ncbi:hypothetical protein BASA81_007893 [Batrachochytrium salamandrivorans]|nr:hypothetical protein BASA81_007893 [Batrachochytrium salamandrivorans]
MWCCLGANNRVLQERSGWFIICSSLGVGGLEYCLGLPPAAYIRFHLGLNVKTLLMRACVADSQARTHTFARNENMDKVCRQVVESWMFELAFSLVIICNAVVLMLYDPLSGPNEPIRNRLVQNSEVVFLCLFTGEFVLKLFVLRWKYFASKWNWMDSLILLVGWIQFGLGNFGSNTPVTSVFRLLRLIRPLQAMNPSLIWVTQSLYRAGPMICSAAVVFVMLQIVFAICGLLYFSGALLHRCSNDTEQLCSTLSWRGVQCENGGICEITASNPDNNITSFDDVFHVIPILFQAMTMEG